MTYDLQCWPSRDRHAHRIYVSGLIYERLGRLITPYFTEDMWYKWPIPRVTHLPKE